LLAKGVDLWEVPFIYESWKEDEESEEPDLEIKPDE
jgi:hypothetical protein